MTITSTEVHLNSRPTGPLSADNFAFVHRELPSPGGGQVVVENTYMSVDPYMRRRMNAGRFYMPPFEVGEVLKGGAVGVVVVSEAESLPVGTPVLHNAGWRTHELLDARRVVPIDVGRVSDSAYLGVLGLPGMTAFVGLYDIAGLVEGDTVFVSGAAGSVGSLVGQLAKLKGCRVIGSAGSGDKVEWLRELGFDEVINYKDAPIGEQLAGAAPDGIDVYFDNVGVDHLAAAIDCANNFARMALCGSIADYDTAASIPGPSNLFEVVSRRIAMKGFIVADHNERRADFLAEVEPMVADGTVQHRETILEGIENAPEALMQLFRGSNTGKMLVRLS